MILASLSGKQFMVYTKTFWECLVHEKKTKVIKF